MYCLIQPYGKQTTLGIIDFNSCQYYIFDPQNNNSEGRLLVITHHIAEELANICLLKDGNLTYNKCPYHALPYSLYNFILICGYIKGSMNDKNLKTDKIGIIGEQLSKIMDNKSKKSHKFNCAYDEIIDEELTKKEE